jgi:CRP-like cAMP-binding protein
MVENRVLSVIAHRHPECRTRVKRLDFVHGDMFGTSGEPIEHAVFPTSGMISIVVALRNGEMIEAGMVGREGVLGGSAALGGTKHVNSSFAQLAGTAYLLAAADLAEIARKDEVVRSLLFAYEQFILAQAQQTAACNAKHHILQRLSSWLLRARDAVDQDEMYLTQEFLAQMLGVQRASVSGFAGQLQDMDLIRYRRGRLTIVDGAGLAGQACECHATLRARRHGLLGVHDEPARPAAHRPAGQGVTQF